VFEQALLFNSKSLKFVAQANHHSIPELKINHDVEFIQPKLGGDIYALCINAMLEKPYANHQRV
jgi:hypothetical protein